MQRAHGRRSEVRRDCHVGAQHPGELWKRFGPLDVLKGINLEIESGEFTVLVGPSGCGKSTLLNIIAGLEKLRAPARSRSAGGW